MTAVRPDPAATALDGAGRCGGTAGPAAATTGPPEAGRLDRILARVQEAGWVPADDALTIWRCDLRARHDGLHRHRNYVWTDDGATDYAPVEFDATRAGQPWRRRSTPTLRQQRERNRWLAEQYETKSRRRAG